MLSSVSRISHSGVHAADDPMARICQSVRRLADALIEQRSFSSDRWTELATAPTIGRIRLSRLSVGEHLNGLFEPVPGTGDQPVNVLVLRLGSGEQVALVAPESFTEPRVTVRAHGDGPSTRDALREFTGLDIETG